MKINLTRLQDILDEVHDISLFDALQLLQEQEEEEEEEYTPQYEPREDFGYFGEMGMMED